MGIIAWIVFGLIAGVIAKLLMPGRDGGGFILTCILGIVGKNETITTPRLSFRFLNVSPAVERELQRIIFSLEREARERANKVRE